MTVRELIKALRQWPMDAEVITEGCDCNGRTTEVQNFDDSYNVHTLGKHELATKIIIKR